MARRRRKPHRSERGRVSRHLPTLRRHLAERGGELPEFSCPGFSHQSASSCRGAVETPAVPSKRSLVEVPQLGPDELLAVDHPHDEHAPYEAGARVYAMFDGLFYPAIVVR